VRRWIGFAPLIVLIALGVLFAGYALKHDPHVQPHALVGKPVPAVACPTSTPARWSPCGKAPSGPRSDQLLRLVVRPLPGRGPQLMALKAQGVTLVGVAYKDEPARTQAFLAELGDPFAVKLVDRDGRAGIEFGVTGVPETFLVGADGVILAKHSGPLTGDGSGRPDARGLLPGGPDGRWPDAAGRSRPRRCRCRPWPSRSSARRRSRPFVQPDAQPQKILRPGSLLNIVV
jgi:cytochrome c biogenesis protein CcmG/thiol:disulfide interchange protein DsbE